VYLLNTIEKVEKRILVLFTALSAGQFETDECSVF
jgi:hypothetical protein